MNKRRSPTSKSCDNCYAIRYCAQTGYCVQSNTDSEDILFIPLNANSLLAMGLNTGVGATLHGTTNPTNRRFRPGYPHGGGRPSLSNKTRETDENNST